MSKIPASMRQAAADYLRAGAAAILAVIEWLSGDECRELDEAGLIAGLGRRLRSAGLPVDRLVLHRWTLHPDILGRAVAWAPDQPVEIHDREQGIEPATAFGGGALRQAMAAREILTLRADALGWTRIDVFRGRGLVELLVMPLANADGPFCAVSFGTARPGGFGAAEQAALHRIASALRTQCELRLLRQTELSLLDTYRGPATAGRVLAGRIRRGQVETLEAALMLCEAPGLAAPVPQDADEGALARLDAYLDRVETAIAAAGGAVLRVVDDAVLAVFPADDAAASCRAALRASERITCPAVAEAGIEPGIALHYGALGYGLARISRRADLTLLGAAVALLPAVRRIGAASGHRLLFSDQFAALIGGDRTIPIGRHRLDAAAQPVAVFTARAGRPSRRSPRPAGPARPGDCTDAG